MITVEPANNGHVWDLLFSGHFVSCCPLSEVKNIIIRTIGKSPFGTIILSFVRRLFILCPLSECPLSEVPLYYNKALVIAYTFIKRTLQVEDSSESYFKQWTKWLILM